MATYYKYQNPSEIGAAPTLDWGTVISDVNKTLQAQEQQRYENREADKKSTNDILTKVNEVSLTSDPKANAILTRSFYQIKEAKLLGLRNLQNGKISRSDYNISNQNTSSSIAELQKFSTEYQGRYTNFQKALSEGKVTDFSKATQEYMGSFQNMTDKDLIYNAKDGFMYMATLDPKTREVVPGPLGMLPISSLNTEKIYNDTKINLPEKLASYTDKIQPFIKILREGKVESIEGIQQYSEFDQFMTNLTEAIAPDNFAKADLLTQLGIYDVDVKNPSTDKTIGSNRAGDGTITPDIKPEMNEKLKVALTRFIVANEGYKQTGTEVFAPQTRAAGKEGKPSKYGPPTVGKTGPLTEKGTKKVVGAVIGVGGVIVSTGKGIEERVDAISYDRGKFKMKVTNISGTETDEITTGDETGGGSVKVGEGKKNIKTRTRILNEIENGPQLSVLITQIPHPTLDRNFESVEEARDFLKREYERRVQGRGATTKKDKKPTAQELIEKYRTKTK
jgi:hypothetical protein